MYNYHYKSAEITKYHNRITFKWFIDYFGSRPQNYK